MSYTKVGNRISLLPMTQFCGLAGELEEFSVKHGCGPLDGQTEVNAARLCVALEKLQVQP